MQIKAGIAAAGGEAPRDPAQFDAQAQAAFDAELRPLVEGFRRLLARYSVPTPTPTTVATYRKFGQDVTVLGGGVARMVRDCPGPFAPLGGDVQAIENRATFVKASESVEAALQELTNQAGELAMGARIDLAVVVDTHVKVRDYTVLNPATDPGTTATLNQASEEVQVLLDKRAAVKQVTTAKTRTASKAKRDVATAEGAAAEASVKAQVAEARAEVAESTAEALQLKLAGQISPPGSGRLSAELSPAPAGRRGRTTRR